MGKRRGKKIKGKGWTPARLQNLDHDFHRLSPAQLMRKYAKPYEVIVATFEYYQAHKRLVLSATVTAAGHTITVYAPGFADGLKPSSY